MRSLCTRLSFIFAITLAWAAHAGEEVAYPRSVPLPNGCPEPKYEQVKVSTRGGLKLVVHEWAPPKNPAGRPVAVLLHGVGIHGAPYASIAAGFTSRGITFLVPDLRGHGRSEGERGELAEPHVLRADLDAVLDAVKERHPGSPIVLMGESMGGLLAADYARQGQKRLAGLILLAPAFRVHPSRLTEKSGFQALLTSGRVPIASSENLDASSREPGFAKALKADGLAVHEVKPSYLLQIGQMGLDWPRAAADITLPLFVCVAAEDKVIDNKAAEQVYLAAATPKEHKTWRKWDEAYHSLCWDPLTPKVIDELADWTLQRR